jgi:hypothetical protein
VGTVKILARPVIVQFRIFMFPFAAIDAFLITLVVNWVSSQAARRRDERDFKSEIEIWKSEIWVENRESPKKLRVPRWC